LGVLINDNIQQATSETAHTPMLEKRRSTTSWFLDYIFLLGFSSTVNFEA
jgi:hypothetical protein